MLGEALVDESEIRVEQPDDTEVLAQNRGEQELALAGHGRAQILIESVGSGRHRLEFA